MIDVHHAVLQTRFADARVPVLDLMRVMQFAQLRAGHGLVWWTCGRVQFQKVESWSLPHKYRCNADRSTQRRQRAAGEARTRLVVLRPNDTDREAMTARWWLFATDPIPGEALQDLRDRRHRIRIDPFELVRLTTPGNGARWTWRVQDEAWRHYMRAGLHCSSRRDLAQAQTLIDDMSRWPGMAGINRQRHELYRLMQRNAGGRLTLPRNLYVGRWLGLS